MVRGRLSSERKTPEVPGTTRRDDALSRSGRASIGAIDAIADAMLSTAADPFAPTPLLLASLAPPTRNSKKRPRHEDQQLPPPTPAASFTPASAASASASSAAAPPQTRAPVLPAETIAALQALRKPLRDPSLSEEARASKCASGLEALLLHAEPEAVVAACEVIGFAELPDEAVLCACQAAAKPDVGGRAAAAFVGAVLRPRLSALTSQATRTLFTAMTALLAQHARPLLDELILPTLWQGGGALSAGQAEVLTRLLKELPESLLSRAVAEFLAGERGQPSSWSEAQVSLLQALLNRKPALDAACLGELVVQCDANVDELKKSLKFSNLLNTLVRCHGGPALRAHLPSLRRVVERIDTFMKKGILQAVGKLE